MLNSGITLGIVPIGYPQERLKDDDIQQVRKDVLKLIFEQRDGDVKPKFTQGISARAGWCAIHCSNEETVQWIQKQALWESKGYQVLLEDEIPKNYTIMGYFKNCLEDDTAFILGVVQGCNSGLPTSDWKVVNRKDDKEANLSIITIEINQGALETLKDLRFQVDYGMGQRVRLRQVSKENSKAPPKEDPPTATNLPGPSVTSTPTRNNLASNKQATKSSQDTKPKNKADNPRANYRDMKAPGPSKSRP